MKRHSLNQRNAGHARSCRGFTLLELLVVMAIIIFLVSITVVVVGAALDTARESATKTTIRKVDGLLTKRMEAFTIAMEKQNASTHPRYISNAALYPSGLTPFNKNVSPFILGGRNIHRAKVLGQKGLFRAGFPQTIAEVVAVDPGLLDGNTNTPSTAADSSEAMYIFLTKMESFGLPAVDEDAFTSNEIGDTDGDKLKEFVDGWDRPIRFYRWPTRLIRPSASASTAQSLNKGNYTIPVKTKQYAGQAGYGASIFFGTLPGPSSLAKDPDDSLGATRKASWAFENPDTEKVINMTPTLFESAPTTGFGLNTPDTWSIPLIVSAGEDGVLGLYETTEPGNFGHLAQPYTSTSQLEGILDNISNRSMQP